MCFFTVDGEREEGGCDFSEWSDYGPCSMTCGVGQRARVRSVRGITDTVDNLKCTGSLTQVEPCDAGLCIGQRICMHRMMNVGVHHWWLNWPQATGRHVSNKQHSWPYSLAKSSMVTSCFPHTESCEWHAVETGECVPNCGGGQKREYYVITQRPANGGEDCPPFVYRNDSVKDCCRE